MEFEQLVLKNKNSEDQEIEVIFLPEVGMNMISYIVGEHEAIDGETMPLFFERFAGLGAMIGPHFHRRKQEDVVDIRDKSVFPHLERLKAKGVTEPFSHGLGRHAPWNVESDGKSFYAVQKGSDIWRGHSLAELEGFDYKMVFEGELLPMGLRLKLSTYSENPSVCGLHYYYNMANQREELCQVLFQNIQPYYVCKGEKKEIPKEAFLPTEEGKECGAFSLYLDGDFDHSFFPVEGRASTLSLLTEEQVVTVHRPAGKDQSWQLYHPKGASFACLEPLSSTHPKEPQTGESSIEVMISLSPAVEQEPQELTEAVFTEE